MLYKNLIVDRESTLTRSVNLTRKANHSISRHRLLLNINVDIFLISGDKRYLDLDVSNLVHLWPDSIIYFNLSRQSSQKTDLNDSMFSDVSFDKAKGESSTDL